MRFILTTILLVFTMTTPTASVVFANDDVKGSPSCAYCGMDREKFAQTRMLIDYDDGTKAATCSIHCTAVDLALQIDKSPKMISVADFDSKKLIDAEKAIWVIGGKRPGVMTKNGKWAFASREAADRFQKENGGRIATFDEAMKASYEEMYDDTKMIREKRKAKKMHHQM
jgi:nitrous oxide reductase accessory protein NosL